MLVSVQVESDTVEPGYLISRLYTREMPDGTGTGEVKFAVPVIERWRQHGRIYDT